MQEGTGDGGRPFVDLAPPRVVLQALTRWAPVIGAIGLVVAAAVWLLGGDRGDDEATARLGLTDEVVWPFYDQARDELTGTVDEVRERVERELGTPLLDLRTSTPPDQTYVDVIAVADDAATATRGADLAAAFMVEQAEGTTRQGEQAELESVLAELAVIDRRAATLRAAIDESLDATAATPGTTPADSVRRERRALARSELSEELDELVRRRVQLSADVWDLRRSLESDQPDAELVRRASTGDEGGRSWTRPVLAGLVAALLAAIAVVVLDRERGRIRDPWYVEGAAGIELLADLRTARGRERLAARLDDELVAGDAALLRGAVVGVLVVAGSAARWAGAIADSLLTAGHPARLDDPRPDGDGGELDLATPPTAVLAIDERLRLTEQHRRARACAGLVIAVVPDQPLRALRRTVARARDLPAPLLGAVIVDPNRHLGPSVDLRAPEHVTDPAGRSPTR